MLKTLLPKVYPSKTLVRFLAHRLKNVEHYITNCVPIEDSDLAAQMRSLIWVFDLRTCQPLHLLDIGYM